MDKIIYKELSYKIVGILFDVFKCLGGGCQEKYYQRAIKKAFAEKVFRVLGIRKSSFQESLGHLRFPAGAIGLPLQLPKNGTVRGTGSAAGAFFGFLDHNFFRKHDYLLLAC